MRIDLPVRPSLCALCRELVAEGADPDEPVYVYRGGTPCFLPMPLGRWAALMTEEGGTRSVRFRRWRQMPPESGVCGPQAGGKGGAA